jgi:hypothetical protein
MLVYGSSMEKLVDYAGASFQRASDYLSNFGAANALARTSGPAIVVIMVTQPSKLSFQGEH